VSSAVRRLEEMTSLLRATPHHAWLSLAACHSRSSSSATHWHAVHTSSCNGRTTPAMPALGTAAFVPTPTRHVGGRTRSPWG
jgi:hypothetical protein